MTYGSHTTRVMIYDKHLMGKVRVVLQYSIDDNTKGKISIPLSEPFKFTKQAPTHWSPIPPILSSAMGQLLETTEVSSPTPPPHENHSIVCLS